MAGQRLEGGSADKVQRGLGRHDSDIVARFGQPTQNLARLVRGDPTADAKNDERLGGVVGRT
jgi:hypothetical protein